MKPSPAAKTKRWDKYELYEKSVQDAEGTALMVHHDYRKVRGKPAFRLREDFAGTGALAAAWARRDARNTAVAVDLDPEPLGWGLQHHLRPGEPGADRVEIVNGDVLAAHGRNYDIILAFNFSWLVLRKREDLKRYLGQVRDALATDGIAQFDMYGGTDAITCSEASSKIGKFTYIWDQAKFDPTTNEAWCAIHWKLPGGRQMRNAFTYHWRLWSLPELLDLFDEVGLSLVEIHAEDDSPVDGRYRRVRKVPNWDAWTVKVLAERRKKS
jgi:hypothetical protein